MKFSSTLAGINEDAFIKASNFYFFFLLKHKMSNLYYKY